MASAVGGTQTSALLLLLEQDAISLFHSFRQRETWVFGKQFANKAIQLVAISSLLCGQLPILHDRTHA